VVVGAAAARARRGAGWQRVSGPRGLLLALLLLLLLFCCVVVVNNNGGGGGGAGRCGVPRGAWSAVRWKVATFPAAARCNGGRVPRACA